MVAPAGPRGTTSSGPSEGSWLFAGCLVLEDAWNTIVAGDRISMEQHTLVRLASAHATRASAAAADFAYTAGGGTALYRTSPLQRYMRDVHAVTQHIIVAPQTFTAAGRVLAGLDPGTPVF